MQIEIKHPTYLVSQLQQESVPVELLLEKPKLRWEFRASASFSVHQLYKSAPKRLSLHASVSMQPVPELDFYLVLSSPPHPACLLPHWWGAILA